MIRFDFSSGGCASGPVVMGIGVFDGVHLGHRKMISVLSDMARRLGAVPVALTFFPHPRAVLFPDDPPRLLLPPEERLERLREAGAAEVMSVDFTKETAETPPERFLEQLLTASPNLRGICVGAHWRFGRGGAGDAAFLSRELAARKIAFEAVPELAMNGGVVSSSAIRKAVAEGDLEYAAAMLGSHPALFGEVEHGFGEAGRLLDAPTANLRVDFGVLPPCGVYAAMAKIGAGAFPAAVNIGVAPTFGRERRIRVEAHMMGFAGDLYQRNISLGLVKKLRDERAFRSSGELARQIVADREEALKILTAASGEIS